MGWVKQQVMPTKEIFCEVTTKMVWKGVPKGNSSAYEFFSDYLRDNYDVTLEQCGELCEMFKGFYAIDRFYAGE